MTWKDAKLVPGWSDTTLVSDSVGAADTNTHKYVQKRKGKKTILSSRQLGRYLNKFASCSYAFIRSMRGKKRIIALMNIMIFPVIAFSFISLTASTSGEWWMLNIYGGNPILFIIYLFKKLLNESSFYGSNSWAVTLSHWFNIGLLFFRRVLLWRGTLW